MSDEDSLTQILEVLPPSLRPPDLEAQLGRYLELLLDANQRVNLVSRQNTQLHATRFARESLVLARLLREEQEATPRPNPPRLLDVGSGGGFPGLVLKLALPEIEVHLVEARRKKTEFLQAAGETLSVQGLTVTWGRAEEISNRKHASYLPAYRQHFDWVTVKGVGSIRDTTRLAAPFLATRGMHWTFKGATCRSELEAAGGLFRQQGFAVQQVEPLWAGSSSSIVGIRLLARRRPTP